MEFSQINWPKVCFVTGIGTDIGKTFATAAIARKMREEGLNVITQKFIQTGCVGISIDIAEHRRLMNMPLQTVDKAGITAPLTYSYPASPHLAAKLDNKPLNPEVANEATKLLLQQYSHVLVEGAGGLMVPVTENLLTIDYIKDHNLPVILVTNGRLGSISDTLLALHALKTYGITLFAVIYNPFFDTDKTIAEDALAFMQSYVNKNYPSTIWITME